MQILAEAEEREIQRLVAMVVEVQLRKLDAKLEHFHQLEQVLEKERLHVRTVDVRSLRRVSLTQLFPLKNKKLEQERQRLFAERTALQKARVASSSGQTMDQSTSGGFPLPVASPQTASSSSAYATAMNQEERERMDRERQQRIKEAQQRLEADRQQYMYGRQTTAQPSPQPGSGGSATGEGFTQEGTPAPAPASSTNPPSV